MISFIFLLTVTQISSIYCTLITDVTKEFYLNNSFNINSGFQISINQSHFTKSFKSNLMIPNDTDYVIIIRNASLIRGGLQSNCNPLYIGFAYRYTFPSGDTAFKNPKMKYSFKEKEEPFSYTIIPYRRNDFLIKYFQNKECNKTMSTLNVIGILAYKPRGEFCPKRNQSKLILEDHYFSYHRTICIDKYEIGIKGMLTKFGALFLNYTDKPLKKPKVKRKSYLDIEDEEDDDSIGLIVSVVVIVIVIVVATGITIHLMRTRKQKKHLEMVVRELEERLSLVETDSAFISNSQISLRYARSISQCKDESSYKHIPEYRTDDKFSPVGKSIKGSETLGTVQKLGPEGAFVCASEQYRDLVNKEWKTIYSGGALTRICTVPYFVECDNCPIRFLVTFSLEKHNREKFQLSAKLLPRNFINRCVKLPLTFKMEIRIEIGEAKKEECEFVCEELDSYSDKQMVSLVPGVEEKFPKIFIRVVDIKKE